MTIVTISSMVANVCIVVDGGKIVCMPNILFRELVLLSRPYCVPLSFQDEVVHTVENVNGRNSKVV